jgi:hypothetical protein
MLNLINIRQVGAELFHAAGQMDRRYDEANLTYKL